MSNPSFKTLIILDHIVLAVDTFINKIVTNNQTAIYSLPCTVKCEHLSDKVYAIGAPQ